LAASLSIFSRCLVKPRSLRERAFKMKRFRILGFLLALAVCQRAQAQTATVTWTTTYQTMDGFGASSAFEGSSMTSANANTMFSATSGAGFSLLRTLIPSNCPDSPGSCATVNSGCAGGNTGDMALAVAAGSGVRIFSSPWTPPASMKSNSSCTNGGSLNSGSYAAYATWLTNYVESVQTYASITPYAISVQNEPDQTTDYDSATWTAQNIHDFILNNLGPSFSTAGLTTKIIMPDSSLSRLLGTYANTTMEDSAAAAYVGIVSDHDYDNAQVSYTTCAGCSTPRPQWMTEVSTLSGSFDPTMTSGLKWAQEIHNNMTLGVTAWVFWTWQSSANPSQQLIDESTGTVSQSLWAIGNWSKYVRPGWVRIDATASPVSGVYVTAFKEASSGNFAIVAVNQNSSSVNLSFSLAGFPSVASVTPTVTSESVNLADQPGVSVSSAAFSYSLPATSVVTFHAATSSSISKSPAPPTALAATVN
jgi:glucuronoarabinoxylan endo-1,4-beta-xylanase